MLTLKTDLTNDDYKFNSSYLKYLMQQRGNLPQLTNIKIDKNNDSEKNFDKLITMLAENGQVEAMELYCNNLSPMSNFNSKIVSNFRTIEAKDAKEARENLSLYAYYNWYVNCHRLSDRVENLENLEVYQKSKQYYNAAFQQLYKLGKTDPIAKCNAFLLRKQVLPDDEHLRMISNLRTQIFEASKHQLNEEKKLKLMFSYCVNLVMYAPLNEYKSRQSLVNSVLSAIQRSMISSDERIRRFEVEK